MATQNENGEWVWQKATPGLYWHAQGKFMGVTLAGDETSNPSINSIVLKYFNRGILSLRGQVRPGPDIKERKPSNAKNEFDLAKLNGMALNFHYLAEPGKFPSDVNKDNIDQWLNRRLSDTADMILNYKLDQPVLVVLNEAWEIGAKWNRDSNPIKDKYGEKWLEEYFYQAFSVFISRGLVPNKDFILTLNELEMFSNLYKQRLVHNKLLDARRSAFEKLIENPIYAQRLSDLAINRPEDIKIILELQEPENYGELSMFFQQLNSIADSFSDLGGVILTEVNPKTQKQKFLVYATQNLANNPNFRGIIFWNLFTIDPSDISLTHVLELFSKDGSPTMLFYELLRENPNR